MRSKRFLSVFFLAIFVFSLGLASQATAAEKWPSKPITLIVGFSAGGGTDVISRALAKEMGKSLGTRIMVVNMSGASGSVAGMEVHKKKADGYTWFGCANNTGRWRPLGYTDLTFTDFYGFFAATDTQGIVVLPDSPWKTIDDLVADIKANPKKLRYGVSGRGASGHIAGELFLSAVGLQGNAVAIPYKGAREAGTKLLAKECEYYVSGIADIRDFVDAGKMKVLGVFDFNDLEITGKYAHVAPSLVKKWPEVEKCTPMNPIWGVQISRETPIEIVDKITEAFVKAVETPDFKNFAKKRGLTIFPHVGLASDQVTAKVESAYCWGFQDIGMAKVSPDKLGVPKPENWKWPPHEKAAKVKPWPEKWANFKPYVVNP